MHPLRAAPTTLRAAGVAAAMGLCAVALAPAVTAAPMAAGTVHAVSVPAAQQYFWKWSDGSQKTSRTFKQSQYQSAAKLPKLLVTAQPAKPTRTVYLEFSQKGKWVLESKTKTNSKGVATLSLIPYCDNQKWCSGTWNYRLKVGRSYQNLKLTYSRK